MENKRFWLGMDHRNDLKRNDKILVGNIDNAEAEFIDLAELLSVLSTLDLSEGAGRLYFTPEERAKLGALAQGASLAEIAGNFYPLSENPANYLTSDSSIAVAQLIGVLAVAQIPNIDASKVVSGVLNAARIPTLPASKVTSGTFAAARIPQLPLSKIEGIAIEFARYILTTAIGQAGGVAPLGADGKIGTAFIPDLDASKVTGGVLNPARIPDLPYVTEEDLQNQAIAISPEQGDGVTVTNEDGIKVAVDGTAHFFDNEFYLFIGQSNMIGRADGGILMDTLDAPDERIFEVSQGNNMDNYYYAAPEGELMLAQLPNQRSVNTGASIPHSFAKKRLALNSGVKKIAYVVVAYGGSGYANNFWNVGDLAYNEAVAAAKDFLVAHPGYKLAGIIDHQGESDALVQSAADAFENNKVTMVNALRSDLGQDAPFICGTMVSEWIGADTARLTVDAVHRGIADSLDFADFADLSSLSGIAGDVIHFDTPSLRTAGAIYAAALQRAIRANNGLGYIIPSYRSNADNNFKDIYIEDPSQVFNDTQRGVVLKTDLVGFDTNMKLNGKSSTKMLWINLEEYPAGFGNIISGFKTSLEDSHYWGLRGYGQGVTNGDTRANVPPYILEDIPIDDSWVHIAITYQDNELILYTNGVEVQRATVDNTIDLDTQNVQLARLDDIGALVSIKALLDDVRIYPFALTEGQILKIHNETAGERYGFDASRYASKAQGEKADTALQPNGDASQLTNVDAATLNGLNRTVFATPSTVANRDFAGDLTSRLFRTTFPVSNAIANSAQIIMRIDNDSDNYHRPISKVGFKNWLNETIATGSFDNITQTGVYRVNNNVTNAPEEGEFWGLYVSGNNAPVITQIAIHYQSGALYSRAFNSSWSPWLRAVTSNNGTINLGGGDIIGGDLLQSARMTTNTLTAARVIMTGSGFGAPASANQFGTKGEIRYDDDYMYICVQGGTWKRTELASW